MPNLALQIKNPEFDLAADARQGQALRGGQVQNQLAEYDLREKGGQANALNDYRTAAKAGDKNAMSKLTGYPEIQAQIHDALKKMEPDKAKEAADRGEAIGKAALYVQGFAAGSPERTKAWGVAIDGLLKAGAIDKAQADHWKATGPSDLLIHQALGVKGAIDAYKKEQETADLDPKDVLDIEGKVNDFNQHYFPTGKIGVQPEEMRARDEAVAVYRTNLIEAVRAAYAAKGGGQKPAAKAVLTAPGKGDRGGAAPAAGGNATFTTPQLGAPGGKDQSRVGTTEAAKPLPANATGIAIPKGTNGTVSALPPLDQGGGATGGALGKVDKGTVTTAPAEPEKPVNLKEWKPGQPIPATHKNAVKITGTPAQQRAQLQKLPTGTPVILLDGTPTYRN